MGKIKKSIVRTGVAYKTGEKRTEKVKEQKQKQKGSIKRTEREYREREERQKERNAEHKVSQILTKKKKYI